MKNTETGRNSRQFCASVIFVAALAISLPLGAQSLPQAKQSLVAAYSQGELSRSLVGTAAEAGADYSGSLSRTSRGDFVWKKVRDEVDPKGFRHVFVRQCLRTGSAEYVEIIGAEVGLHYAKNGVLTAAVGMQVTAPEVVNDVRIARSDAHRRALMALSSGPMQAKQYDDLSPAMRSYRDEHVRLLLFPTADGNLRFAYHVFVSPVDVNTINDVWLDAETGAILASVDSIKNSNCGPTSTNMVSAWNWPVRPDAPTCGQYSGCQRPNLAGVSAINNFPYEGTWPGNTPHNSVYQETWNYAFRCSVSIPGRPSYTLFPIQDQGELDCTPT